MYPQTVYFRETPTFTPEIPRNGKNRSPDLATLVGFAREAPGIAAVRSVNVFFSTPPPLFYLASEPVPLLHRAIAALSVRSIRTSVRTRALVIRSSPVRKRFETSTRTGFRGYPVCSHDLRSDKRVFELFRYCIFLIFRLIHLKKKKMHDILNKHRLALLGAKHMHKTSIMENVGPEVTPTVAPVSPEPLSWLWSMVVLVILFCIVGGFTQWFFLESDRASQRCRRKFRHKKKTSKNTQKVNNIS